MSVLLLYYHVAMRVNRVYFPFTSSLPEPVLYFWLVLPKNLVEKGGSAFALNFNMTGILDIPASVKKIGPSAFTGSTYTGIIVNSSFVED